MKKSTLVFIVAALVILSTGVLIAVSSESLNTTDYVQFSVIFLLVLFAMFIGIRRFGSEKRGEPSDDELSRKILQKASSVSYYISLYIWVVIIYLKDRVTMDTEELMGSGILAMGVVFGMSWLYYHIRGLRHD